MADDLTLESPEFWQQRWEEDVLNKCNNTELDKMNDRSSMPSNQLEENKHQHNLIFEHEKQCGNGNTENQITKRGRGSSKDVENKIKTGLKETGKDGWCEGGCSNPHSHKTQNCPDLLAMVQDDKLESDLKQEPFSYTCQNIQPQSGPVEQLRILYWNVDGIKNKHKIFYNDLLNARPKIFFLSETFHRNNFSSNLLEQTYKLISCEGNRDGQVGRFSKGYVLGIEKTIYHSVKRISSDKYHYKLQIKNGANHINIVFCYIPPPASRNVRRRFKQNHFEIIEKIFKKVSSRDDTIVMGDFNARIGQYSNNKDRPRLSKDKIVNQRGKQLKSLLKQHPYLCVLNGMTKSDSHGEYTFINKNGSSLIDLCMVSDNIVQNSDLKVLDSCASSHFPIEFTLNNSKVLSKSGGADLVPDLGEIQVLKSHYGASKFNPKWFDGKCLNRKVKTEEALQKLRNCRDSKCEKELAKEYVVCRKWYSKLMKAKKILYDKKVYGRSPMPKTNLYYKLRYHKFQKNPLKKLSKLHALRLKIQNYQRRK